MNVEELRDYCLSLPQAKENAPWTEPQYQMLVTFTVGSKWFCLADVEKKFIDVKCDPAVVQDTIDRYEGAFPAWHMNKEHWLGIRLESDVPNDIIRKLLKDGYELIVKSFSEAKRKELGIG